mmetsp:Transcript_133424/g.266205  ORF Transcript_133424/g.266205 Transcript_133424/m.266205 type:complete len:208 (+) Transcript_133424:485-1108(+)
MFAKFLNIVRLRLLSQLAKASLRVGLARPANGFLTFAKLIIIWWMKLAARCSLVCGPCKLEPLKPPLLARRSSCLRVVWPLLSSPTPTTTCDHVAEVEVALCLLITAEVLNELPSSTSISRRRIRSLPFRARARRETFSTIVPTSSWTRLQRASTSSSKCPMRRRQNSRSLPSVWYRSVSRPSSAWWNAVIFNSGSTVCNNSASIVF